VQEPWFDINVGAWLGGAVGIFGGVMGSLIGTLAPRGRARGLVLGLMWIAIVACGLMLVAGITAWFLGQPYAVWYGLGLCGLIGTIVFSSLMPVVYARYREAEMRKSQAKDL
jgi:MFS family permease